MNTNKTKETIKELSIVCLRKCSIVDWCMFCNTSTFELGCQTHSTFSNIS